MEAAVSAYLAMLRRELRGERPSRKATWAPLVDRLGRSKGSVEYELGNISAALLALGLPCSDGHEPYENGPRGASTASKSRRCAGPGSVMSTSSLGTAGR